MVDYVWQEPISVIIVTNKVASSSDLQVIENFVKNVENVNSENIKSPSVKFTNGGLRFSLLYFLFLFLFRFVFLFSIFRTTRVRV